jgi:hypothetical protein
MYEGVSQQERYTAFNAASDIAGEVVNPINWYKYNPGMWSVSRGQVKIPLLNAKNIGWVGRQVSRVPGAERFVKDMSSMVDKSQFGGVLTSKSVWYGLKAKNEKGLLGTYIDSTKPVDKFGDTRSALRSFRDDMTRAGAARARPNPLYKGAAAKAAEEIVTDSAKKTRFMGYTSKVASGIDKSAAVVSKAPWKSFAKTAFRGTVKAGVAVGKGFAYYEMAKLAFSTANYLFQPLGRAAFAAMDAGLNKLESIATPELGGQLSMSYISQGAATERQRALAAISKSRLNARSAMGGEASYIHR